MKSQVATLFVLMAVVFSVVSAEERTKRGVLTAAAYTAPIATAAYYTPTAAYYAAAPYVAAPNPVVARASRIVGAPGFAARYTAYAAPIAAAAYTAPIAASAPYTVLY